MLILGSLDGVETGIRRLTSRRPLEVEEVDVPGGRIWVPTLEEMLRIKAWLVVRRNATRDYLDVVGLADRVGVERAAGVLLQIDDYCEDQIGEGGRRVAAQVAKQLMEPSPYDLSEVDLATIRSLDARWRTWVAVAGATGDVGTRMLELIVGGR